MEKRFYTIKNNKQIEIIEKKSRFIANIFYVESKQESEEIIKQTKKKIKYRQKKMSQNYRK